MRAPSRLTPIVLALTSLASLAMAQTPAPRTRGPLVVGTATAVPGGRTRGVLTAGEHVDGTPVALPVEIVSGRRPGPTVWIGALTHGDEYGGARALQMVLKALDAEVMAGSVVAVLANNPLAFQATQRVNPNLDDLADLGRSFPGRADLFATDRLAATIFESVKASADYLVDLHTGGDRFRQHPFVLYTPTPAIPDARYDQLARSFGVETLWRDTVPVFRGSAVTPASAAGIPAFLVEIGGGHPLMEADLLQQSGSVLSFLRATGVLPGAPIALPSYAVVTGYRVATNQKGGYLHPAVKPGDAVKAGTVLGTVTNVYGDVVETLRAPEGSDIVLGVITYPAWASGGWLFELGSGLRREP